MLEEQRLTLEYYVYMNKNKEKGTLENNVAIAINNLLSSYELELEKVKELVDHIKDQDKYINGLHDDLQEALWQLDKLRGETNE